MNHEYCDRCKSEMNLVKVEFAYNENNGDLIAFTEYFCEHKIVSSGHLCDNIPLECEVAE